MRAAVRDGAAGGKKKHFFLKQFQIFLSVPAEFELIFLVRMTKADLF